MERISTSTIKEIALNGSEEDFVHLLRKASAYAISNADDVGDSGLKVKDRVLDYIIYEAARDRDEARRARKISLAAAYDSGGIDALNKVLERPELKTLRQLAFKGASEKVVELLKAQANDPKAVQAIIEGAQMDRKRRFKRETTDDESRRSDKKDIIAEFYAKSGRFTPAESDAPDALDAQTRIAQLENQLAEVQETVAKQQPAGSTPLRLQQP